MPFPHKYITLTEDERKRLLSESQRFFLIGKYNKQKPLKALYLSDKRNTYKEIAKELKVNYRSVKSWISAYKKGGLDAFIHSLNKSLKREKQPLNGEKLTSKKPVFPP